MLTLNPSLTEQELAAELDDVIQSKAQRINAHEPTFGERIVNLVLAPNYEAWVEADKMRWAASITGVRSARSNGYYRSEVIAGERIIHMTERQSLRAWQILEREELVGQKAQARIRRYRKIDALEKILDDVSVAELVVDSLAETAQQDNGIRLSAAAYLHHVKMEMKIAGIPDGTRQRVVDLLALCDTFNADFRV